MSKVLIVGGGAAGMFASIFAAKNGNEVHVFEKNEKLGKKLFITGKGRCNVTNACDVDELFQNMVSNEKFISKCHAVKHSVYQLFFFLISNFRSRIILRMLSAHWSWK